MTTRDRLVLIGILLLGVLGAGWMLGVSPEREKAAKLDTEVSAAQAQLASAQQQLSEAQGDQTQYTSAYASIVRLGKAVPASEEVPSLVYELDQASNQKSVEFNSIATSTAGGSTSASSASSAATAAAGTSFTPMPFTFIFNGSFVDLYHLLSQIQGFTVQGTAGAVQVSGRLLTIQSASLEIPNGGSGGEEGAKGAKKKPEDAELKGTITASAYVLPAGQGLTGGATAAGPVGASASQPVSGPSAAHPSTAPAAVVKVTP
jgi:type II secretory pathway pseudopilin PulG